MISLIAISVGLAMDAFAVTLSDVMRYPALGKGKKFCLPLVFGIMQGVMPLLGFYLGELFAEYVEAVDHWIALILLTILGVKMICETITENRKGDGEQKSNLSFGQILLQGVATSIDALAVGVTLAVTSSLNVFASAGIIAAITFAICFVALFAGKVGKYLKGYAGIVGGIILIAVGIKIFIEHVAF